jgi:hypothetical protein
VREATRTFDRRPTQKPDRTESRGKPVCRPGSNAIGCTDSGTLAAKRRISGRGAIAQRQRRAQRSRPSIFAGTELRTSGAKFNAAADVSSKPPDA